MSDEQEREVMQAGQVKWVIEGLWTEGREVLILRAWGCW